jgi:hypothetical protein
MKVQLGGAYWSGVKQGNRASPLKPMCSFYGISFSSFNFSRQAQIRDLVHSNPRCDASRSCYAGCCNRHQMTSGNLSRFCQQLQHKRQGPVTKRWKFGIVKQIFGSLICSFISSFPLWCSYTSQINHQPFPCFSIFVCVPTLVKGILEKCLVRHCRQIPIVTP